MLFNRKGRFFLNLDGNADRAKSGSPEAAKPDSDQVSEQTKASESAVAEPAVSEKTMPATAVAEKTVTSTAVDEVSSPSPQDSEQQQNNNDSAVTEKVNAVATLDSLRNDLTIAAAQRPTVSYTTFAPDNLLPGSGLRPRTRRPGAALKDFRSIAQDLFRS